MGTLTIDVGHSLHSHIARLGRYCYLLNMSFSSLKNVLPSDTKITSVPSPWPLTSHSAFFCQLADAQPDLAGSFFIEEINTET